MKAGEFEKEYKRLYMPLGMFALRFVGDIDEAEDLVQSSFEAAWLKINAGAEIDNFKAYMYRAVRNASLSALSRHKGEDTVPVEECSDVPEEEIDTSERDAALWRAVDALPERCREIFLMSKRDGYSNAAIAEELGISVKTVENQMTKAFASLRSSLEGRAGKVFFLPFL